jgi:hypothetical protein
MLISARQLATHISAGAADALMCVRHISLRAQARVRPQRLLEGAAAAASPSHLLEESVLVDARVPHRPPQVRRAAVRVCARARAIYTAARPCRPGVRRVRQQCTSVQQAVLVCKRLVPQHTLLARTRAQTCTLCARACSSTVTDVRTDTCAQKLHAPVRPILIPARQTADAGQQAAALPDSRRRWTAGLVQLPDSKGGPCKKRRASSSCRTAADNGRRPLSSEDDK